VAQGQNVVPFAAVQPPAVSFVLWSAAYVLACLTGAILVFERRDL
jgi:hypothetical protein